MLPQRAGARTVRRSTRRSSVRARRAQLRPPDDRDGRQKVVRDRRPAGRHRHLPRSTPGRRGRPDHASRTASGGAGAYPLDIRLIGPDDSVLDRIITYLVKLPEDLDPIEPLRAAMVFAVHAPPSVGPKGVGGLQTADLDRIAGSRSSARGAPRQPRSRSCRPPRPSRPSPGAGAGPASCSTCSQALPGHQVVDGPYVDVPVSAWISAGHAGRAQPAAGPGQRRAHRAPRRAGPHRVGGVARPDRRGRGGALGGRGHPVRPARDLLRRAARRPGRSPRRPARSRSPPGSTRPSRRSRYDSSLSYALGRDDYDDPELQAQQLVAQLAVIQGEAPERRPAAWCSGLERGQDLS